MAAMPEVMTCGETQVSPALPAGGEWAVRSGPLSDKDSANAKWSPQAASSPALSLSFITLICMEALPPHGPAPK